MKKHQLRRFAGPIDAFDNKKPSGNAMITVSFHAEET
jgi:hypothetical protein